MEAGEALELGAVGEAVGHEDVLVEVVGAGGAVVLDFVNHLADGQDGGGVGLDFRGRRRRGFWVGLAGEALICTRHQREKKNGSRGWLASKVCSPGVPSASGLIGEQKPVKLNQSADQLSSLDGSDATREEPTILEMRSSSQKSRAIPAPKRSRNIRNAEERARRWSRSRRTGLAVSAFHDKANAR